MHDPLGRHSDRQGWSPLLQVAHLRCLIQHVVALLLLLQGFLKLRTATSLTTEMLAVEVDDRNVKALHSERQSQVLVVTEKVPVVLEVVPVEHFEVSATERHEAAVQKGHRSYRGV